MPTTGYELNGEWTDSQSPALSDRVGGTAPNFAAMNGGIYGIQFATNEEVHGSFQLPHSAIPGGELRLHVHFTTATAPVAGTTVIWSVGYSIAGVNGTFPATATEAGTYTFADTTALVHRVQAIKTITLPSPAQSSILIFRAFRSGGDSALEPFLLSIDGHFQQGSYGTTAEYPA